MLTPFQTDQRLIMTNTFFNSMMNLDCVLEQNYACVRAMFLMNLKTFDNTIII